MNLIYFKCNVESGSNHALYTHSMEFSGLALTESRHLTNAFCIFLKRNVGDVKSGDQGGQNDFIIIKSSHDVFVIF